MFPSCLKQKQESQSMTANKNKRIKSRLIHMGISIPCLASFEITALDCQITNQSDLSPPLEPDKSTS